MIVFILSPTSWFFCFQLFVLYFHDVAYAMINMSTMCSRSQWTVLLLTAWTNNVWRLAFIYVQNVRWPPVVLLKSHHSTVLGCYISSLYLMLLSTVTIPQMSILSILAVNQPDLECSTVSWPIKPLHTHWRNIIHHNVVTETETMLTHC